MTDLLPLDPDQLLTTTRSVRKRLDFERPVPLDVVKEALKDLLSVQNRQISVENIQAKRKALTEASGLIKGGQANEVKRESD